MTKWESSRWANRSLSEAEQKRRRYRLVQWRADHSEAFDRPSAAGCQKPAAGNVEVSVTAGGRTHVSGIQRCGSVGACPSCASTIRGRRAVDIEAAVEAAHAVGLQVWFLTLTVPHTADDELGDTLDRVRSYWRRMRESRGTRRLWDSMGVEGFVRAFEVTWSERNGWHPHLHVLLFTRSMQPVPLVDCWRNVWQADGIDSQWVPKVSADLRRVKRGSGAASYLAKVDMAWGVGTEVARSDLKRGRGLTPPQLLELAYSCEYICDEQWLQMSHVARWVEFERSTKGLRWIEWSRGLRDKAACWQVQATTSGVELVGVSLGEGELSDDDAAAAVVREPVVARFLVPAATWSRARGRGELGTLLWSLVCGVGSEHGVAAGFEVYRAELDPDPPPKVLAVV